MIMRPGHLLGYSLALGLSLTPLTMALQAQSKPAPQSTNQAAQKNSASTHTSAAKVHNEGERIFAQNCSRCHETPEGFSPRISGTIVRHMRVRAGLSRHDEQELLRFFNP